jgi:hypothetical protein
MVCDNCLMLPIIAFPPSKRCFTLLGFIRRWDIAFCQPLWSSGEGESGNYAGISQKSYVHCALVTSLPHCWPPMGFFPRQAWETGPGSLQSCVVLQPLIARFVCSYRYLQCERKVVKKTDRHFEYCCCGLVRYDTVWSGRGYQCLGGNLSSHWR